MKYICYHNNKYVIDRRCKTGRVTLSCDTENDAQNIRDIFIKNNWVLDLGKPKIFFSGGLYYVLYKPENKIMILYKSSSKSDAKGFVDDFVDTSNICRKRNSYQIQKSIKNRTINYGFYLTLEEAIIFRDKYREHNWDYDYYKKEYKNSTIMRNKYISKTKDGKYKIVKIKSNGNNRVYGTFNDLDKARRFRDYLIKNDWVMPSNRHITKLFGKYWIFNTKRKGGKYARRYYKYSDNASELYNLRDEYVNDGFPSTCLFETTVLHNISVNAKYYFIEKDNQYYYSSTDLLKTIDVRCILEAEDWEYNEGLHKINDMVYDFEYNNRDEKQVSLVSGINYREYIYHQENGDEYVLQYNNDVLVSIKDEVTAKLIVDIMLRFDFNIDLLNVLLEVL